MLTEVVPAGYAKVGPSEGPVLARKGPCLRLEYAHHVATGRFRDYPGRLYGNLALLLGEEGAELHDTALRRGASGCHDWAELEKTARKIIESSLKLADRMWSA